MEYYKVVKNRRIIKYCEDFHDAMEYAAMHGADFVAIRENGKNIEYEIDYQKHLWKCQWMILFLLFVVGVLSVPVLDGNFLFFIIIMAVIGICVASRTLWITY